MKITKSQLNLLIENYLLEAIEDDPEYQAALKAMSAGGMGLRLSEPQAPVSDKTKAAIDKAAKETEQTSNSIRSALDIGLTGAAAVADLFPGIGTSISLSANVANIFNNLSGKKPNWLGVGLAIFSIVGPSGTGEGVSLIVKAVTSGKAIPLGASKLRIIAGALQNFAKSFTVSNVTAKLSDKGVKLKDENKQLLAKYAPEVTKALVDVVPLINKAVKDKEAQQVNKA